MSQNEFASHIGVSFQQIQKFECGSNLVGASRLDMIADAFEVEPGLLLEGLGKSIHRSHDDCDQIQASIACLQIPDGVEQAKTILTISEKSVRQPLLELARTLLSTKRRLK